MNYFLKVGLVLLLFGFVGAGPIEQKKEIYFPELKYLNKNVNPCDNFYEFSCGNFEKYHPRPKDELLWDTFKILQKEIDETSTAILSSKIRKQDPKAVRKAKDMFNACMNVGYVNQLKLQPMASMLEELGGWPLIAGHEAKFTAFNWDYVADLVAKYGLQFLISFDVMPYFLENTNQNMIQINKRDPLTLPQTAISDIDLMPRDLIEENLDKFGKAAENPYKKFLNRIANQMKNYMEKLTDPASISYAINEVFNFMLDIREAPDYPYNITYSDTVPEDIETLQKWSDEFSSNYKTRINWLSFFNRAFKQSGAKVTKKTKLLVADLKTLANTLALVEKTDPVVITNFIITRLVTYMAPDSDYWMWQEYNNFYREMGYNVYNRSYYCTRKVASYPHIGMSLAVAHEFQNYYFNLEKIESAKEMIDDLMEAFFELLDENDWMTDQARSWAKEKAKQILTLIGVPDFVYDPKELDKYYSKLKVCRYDHFGNMLRLRAFSLAKLFSVIDKPKDRTIWSQSPLMVNAFYNSLNNRILFPLSIMNNPFMNSSFVDYGRIGALIGHEITHGFDTKGKKLDGEGTYVGKPWADEVDIAFSQKATCIRDQYSEYYIDEIKKYVNGDISLAENIADNGGLREAYRAYQKLKIRMANKLDTINEFTSDQLFFISYATMWCKIDTTTSLTKMYTDDHAPNRFRVIGVLSNMKEFSDVFKCPLGSKMNPVQKCVLW